MDRQDFDNLIVEKQIEYINKQLSGGITLTGICKNINIGRATIRNRFKTIDFIYSSELNKYICDDSKTTVTKSEIIDNNISETNVTYSENKPLDKYDNNSEIFVSDKKVMKNLIGLSDKYDKILDIIEWFENDNSKTNVIEAISGIRIILPEEKDREFRKTVRINDVVWKQFIKFCDIHKEFTKKDLQSEALLEFMEKYK